MKAWKFEKMAEESNSRSVKLMSEVEVERNCSCCVHKTLLESGKCVPKIEQNCMVVSLNKPSWVGWKETGKGQL